MELVIISGLSGAGKSRVADVLEDMDFYCVDNMPVSLMSRFAELCEASGDKYERVALVTDVRTLDNFNDLFFTLDELSGQGIEYKIIFVEAGTAAIVTGIVEAVEQERELLSPVRDKADFVLDTSEMTLGQLQRKLTKFIRKDSDEQGIIVNIVSFGYKYGVPIDADIVFDVRFLPNPFYVEALKHKNGMDPGVREYIFSRGPTEAFFEKLKDLVTFLLPCYIEEGKRNLVICMGCTGGHHRSVATACALGEFLTERGYNVEYRHRDIEKE